MSMADINEIYAQTPEYRNYVQKSGDKEPTVEKFLETMSPQQRVEFERKYGGKDDRAAEVQKKDKPVEELENVAETERLRSMYSDQNEIWLDRIRVKVLQSMNKVDGSINVDTLSVEQLVEEVKKAEALKEDEQRQYRRAVEKSLEAEMNFDLVPPKALVGWEKHLNKDIAEAKSKDAGADTTNEETVLAAVHGRMDNLINDMADRSGMYWVDKSNIADVYDGYLEMIELRSQNKKGTSAKGILDEWMGKYEHDFGPKSRIKNTNEAMRLRKLIEYVGDMLSIEIDAVITDGSEPIGNGVGAVLEARDVMKVLRNKDDAPQDLREKSLFLAGRMLEFDPKLRGGQGYHVAKEILNSGRALEVMNRIIHAQGKAPQPQLGHLTRDIVSNVSGVVEAIDNARINKIGIWAGAGQYPGAGLDLMKKVGDTVEQGETLYRIHSCNSTDFAFANSVVDGYTGYEISGRGGY